jgi:hypothetical protein
MSDASCSDHGVLPLTAPKFRLHYSSTGEAQTRSQPWTKDGRCAKAAALRAQQRELQQMAGHKLVTYRSSEGARRRPRHRRQGVRCRKAHGQGSLRDRARDPGGLARRTGRPEESCAMRSSRGGSRACRSGAPSSLLRCAGRTRSIAPGPTTPITRLKWRAT